MTSLKITRSMNNKSHLPATKCDEQTRFPTIFSKVTALLSFNALIHAILCSTAATCLLYVSLLQLINKMKISVHTFEFALLFLTPYKKETDNSEHFDYYESCSCTQKHNTPTWLRHLSVTFNDSIKNKINLFFVRLCLFYSRKSVASKFEFWMNAHYE